MRYEKLPSEEKFELDAKGRPVKLERFSGGQKTGAAVYIYYHNPDSPTREQGNFLEGRRVGTWDTYTGKGPIASDGSGKWRKTSATFWSDEGAIQRKVLFHPNGRISLESTYGEDGEANFHRQYNEKGRLTFEGKELPTELE